MAGPECTLLLGGNQCGRRIDMDTDRVDALLKALDRADVVIASRKQEACDALAEAVVAETGQRALALACHVGYWEECDALCAAALDHFGKVDILVNNAGMSPLYPSLKEVSIVLKILLSFVGSITNIKAYAILEKEKCVTAKCTNT